MPSKNQPGPDVRHATLEQQIRAVAWEVHQVRGQPGPSHHEQYSFARDVGDRVRLRLPELFTDLRLVARDPDGMIWWWLRDWFQRPTPR